MLKILIDDPGNRNIARQMNLAPSTVKVYLVTLGKMLSARNRTELGIWAFKEFEKSGNSEQRQ